MQKKFKKKMILILLLFVILVFSLNYGLVYAWTTNFTEDRGPDVGDESTTWWLTYYGGGFACINPLTNEPFEYEDFQINETYGWCEWVYQGVTYVVMAAATQEAMEDGWADTHGWKDYIHYFHYGTPENDFTYSTFQFKFANNGDDTLYNGIVLDSCENSVDPTYYGKPEGTQWLDVYVSPNTEYPRASQHDLFNGQQVFLSSDGEFSESAGTSSSTAKKNFLLDIAAGACSLVGDVFQYIINNTFNLTYTREYIEADFYLKDEIQVAEPNASLETNTIKTIDISNVMDNEKGTRETIFTTDTPIPVMPIDIYTASSNKVDLFSIDFFDLSNENTDKWWNFFSGIVSTVSHMVLYVSAGLLLTMLIWRSVLFVKSSLGDDPGGAKESRRIIDNWVKAIILMSAIYLIATLMIHLYDRILTIILNGNESNYLIRMNIENVYSFNTNYIGYFKYMSMQSNGWGSLAYSGLYFLQSLVSGVWYLCMFIRMHLVGLLIIIAPFTAVTAMNEKSLKKGFSLTNILYFHNWLKAFLFLVWIPLVIVILYRILLAI